MKFSSVLSILGLAATSLAAPAIDILPRTTGQSCAGTGGVVSCCQSLQSTNSQSVISQNPALVGLGVLAGTLTLLNNPDLKLGLTCTNLLVNAIPAVCSQQTACCLASNDSSNNGGLINIANGNSLCVSPTVGL